MISSGGDRTAVVQSVANTTPTELPQLLPVIDKPVQYCSLIRPCVNVLFAVELNQSVTLCFKRVINI
jgi:hypothetical protein